MVPSDTYDCMSITLEEAGPDNAGLTLYRSNRQPFFGRREKALFETLVPHLRRMVRLRRQFEHQQIVHAFNTQALDFLAFGVVLLDREGRVRFANRAAAAIFSTGDGSKLSRERLNTWHHQSSAQLGRAIALALGKDSQAEGGSGSDLCIQRRSGKLPYTLQVLPVTVESDALCVLLPSEARGAVLVITDPDCQLKPPLELLQQMFGLTATEAILAAEIGTGASIRDYADGHGIAEGTARWHLKNVQHKTGTHRVSELVGIVGRIAGKIALD
jgi:DNA-binding CsgD family transcriptional regulator/PAS domain-containing protein